MLTFADGRAQALWLHSDTLALREVRPRCPGVVTDAEWAAVVAMQGWALDGDADMHQARQLPPPAWVTDPDRLQRDWIDHTCGTRWRVACNEIQRSLSRRPVRLCDLGAFAGAHGIALHNLVGGDAELYLIDLAPELADAMRWTITHHAQRPERIHIITGGDYRDLPNNLDVLFCGEVLEHVGQWGPMVRACEMALADGGTMCWTTPTGPWEADSALHAHIAHWEVPDLAQVFGHNEDIRIAGVTYYSGAPPFGWNITTYRVGGRRWHGAIDYPAKLARWGFP